MIERIRLGDGLICVSQENGKGYKIFNEHDIYKTPESLRRNFPSLQEAREAKERWKKGKGPVNYKGAFSLLNK
jgi:hypothetical protein